MREYIKISGVRQDDMGTELIDELKTVYEDGVRTVARGTDRVFECNIPATTELASSILETLRRWGLKPWDDKTRERRKQSEYRYEIRREYEPVEWESCEILDPRPPEWWHDVKRSGDGYLCCPMKQANTKHSILRTQEGILVSASLRWEIEQAGFDGIVFRDVYLLPQAGMHPDESEGPDISQAVSWDELGERWWEIDSERYMPALSPNLHFINGWGQTVSRDHCCDDNGLLVREGPYMPPELHYHRNDVEQMPPFGLARTRERFGPSRMACGHTLLASHAFYRFCRDRELPMEWVPVRIDED